MPRAPSLALLRSQSDERLVLLVRQGHDGAFEAIVERYRRPLYRHCRRILAETRAEDAVQITFLAAWLGLRRGDDVRDLQPWLHRIARNTALNLAGAAGQGHEELDESLRIAEGPDEALGRSAAMRQLFAGIAALPARQREALLRTAVDGHDQDAIARDLGVSNGAVRQLVHRARMALRTAATAAVPLPLTAWAAGMRSEPVYQRIADLAAGGAGAGAAATAAKLGAVVVVAGGAAAGPALLEDRGAPPPSAVARATPAPVARAERKPAVVRDRVVAPAAAPHAPAGTAPRAPAASPEPSPAPAMAQRRRPLREQAQPKRVVADDEPADDEPLEPRHDEERDAERPAGDDRSAEPPHERSGEDAASTTTGGDDGEEAEAGDHLEEQHAATEHVETESFGEHEDGEHDEAD